MSKGKSEAKSVISDFAEVLKQIHNLHLIRQYDDNLCGIMLDTTEDVESISKTLEDLPEKIDEEMRTMREGAAIIANVKQRIMQQRADDRERNRVTAEMQAFVRESQEKEYQAKVAQLKAVEKESAYYGNVLAQKKAKLAGCHQQMQAETGELARRSKVMQRLKAKWEADQAKILKDQKDLESRSAELDKKFIDRQMKIRKIRGQISEKSKALVAVKAENSLKAVELIAVRSKTEDIRAVTDSKKQKLQKIMSEFEAVEKKRKDEIYLLESRIAKERAKYEKVAKIHKDLVDQITSEFGNSKSLEEMTVEAQAELEALDVQCAQLNESLDVICQSMQLNEIKLAELNNAKEDILKRLELAETFAVNQDRQSSRRRSQAVDSEGTKRSSKEQPIFLPPPAMPKKAKRRQKSQQQCEQLNQQAVSQLQAERVVRSADSSETDFGLSTLESSVLNTPNRTTDHHAKLLLFKQHFLGNNGQ